MKSRLFYSLFAILLLGIFPITTHARGTLPGFSPDTGPGGTQVHVSYLSSSCQDIYIQANGDDTASNINAAFSGSDAYFTIPQGYASGTQITIYCVYYDPDGTSFTQLGIFTVSSSCELDA